MNEQDTMTGAEIVAASYPYSEKRSKFTSGTVDTILVAIGDGLTIGQACAAVGITYSCMQKWKEKFPAFAEALEKAREQCRQKMLGLIKTAAEQGDWRAAEVHLRMSFFPQYTKAETNVNVGVQTQFVCTEETRQRLMALNRKLLTDSPEVNETQDALADRENPNNESTSVFQTDSL
jgi:hypothetical protein